MLKEEGKIGDDLINRLMGWRHSGFSVHNRVRVRRDDEQGREALAQYTCPPIFAPNGMHYNILWSMTFGANTDCGI